MDDDDDDDDDVKEKLIGEGKLSHAVQVMKPGCADL